MKEGQAHQIAMLQKHTPLRVFIPMNLNIALELVKYGLDSRPGNVQRELTGKGVVKALQAESNLDAAAKEGSIVVGLQIMGRNLYPSTSSSKLEAMAHAKYPQSFNPVVSYILLENPIDTEVILNGQFSLGDVTKFYLIKYDAEGFHVHDSTQVTTALSPEEFREWYIIHRGHQAEKKSGQPVGTHRWRHTHRLHGDQGHTTH